MAVYTFTGASQTTPTFNPAVDSVVLGVPTSSITNFTQVGSNVQVSTTSGTLTLTGVTLAALASTNFSAQGGGQVLIGDNTNATTNDAFPNTITGGAGNDIILGLGAGDTITTGEGANLVFGGNGQTDTADGSDLISAGTGADTIYGNAGNDTIQGTGAVANTGSDVIYGGLGTDTINSSLLAGDVTSIYGGGGFTDTVDGADAITIASNAGTLFVTGNAGDDVIRLNAQAVGSASVYGGLGNDNIGVTTTGGNALIAGQAGTDTINYQGGAQSNTTIFGGSAITDSTDVADTINATVAGGNATIYSNGGGDTLGLTLSAASRTTVYSGVGADNISINIQGVDAATASSVTIFGGSDSDVISVTGGNEFYNAVIFGGSGIFDSADTADTIIGGAGNEIIYGNGGNDVITTGAGIDQVFGGAGNDTINALTSGNLTVADRIDGNEGSDVLNFLGTGGAATQLNGVTNIETINVTGSAVTVTSLDSLVSSAQTLVLNAGAVTTSFVFDGAAETDGSFNITGSTAAADTITGGSLADTIVGGAGGGSLAGGAGNDLISGGSGVETITGGTGIDSMTGGAGADTFVFAAGATGTPSTTNFDVITDFNNSGDADVIDFTAALTVNATTTAAVAGTAAISNTGLASFNAADVTFAQQLAAVSNAVNAGTNVSGEYAIFNNGGSAYLFVSDGVAGLTANDVLIQLTGVTATVGGTDAAGNITIA